MILFIVMYPLLLYIAIYHFLVCVVMFHLLLCISAVLFTPCSQEETAAAAARAVNDGIMMIAVGVGSRVEGEELLSIAGRNASRVITTPDFPHMQDLLSPLRRKICKTTGNTRSGVGIKMYCNVGNAFKGNLNG